MLGTTQGLHDIASVLLFVLGERQAFACLRTMVRLHLRDCTRCEQRARILSAACRAMCELRRVEGDDAMTVGNVHNVHTRCHHYTCGGGGGGRPSHSSAKPAANHGIHLASRPGMKPMLELPGMLPTTSRNSLFLLFSVFHSFRRPGMEPVLELLGMLLPVLEQADPELAELLDGLGLPPLYALPWVITLFSHNVAGLAPLARLFDLFLGSHPLMPLYASAVVMKARVPSSLPPRVGHLP